MIDTGADRHTHSTTSDGHDDLDTMAEAATAAGLHTWGISDHVRASTPWVPDYVREVRRLREVRQPEDGLSIECGVEVKMLDSAGRLDLPARLEGLDYLLVADHQFPGPEGPVKPEQVRQDLAEARLTPTAVLETLIAATGAALHASPFPAIVAHLFSLLPKCGLDEDDVPEQLVDELATACRATDAAVEINEKWRCPSPRVARHLAERGVRLTAGSDAHQAVDIGAWAYLDEVLIAR